MTRHCTVTSDIEFGKVYDKSAEGFSFRLRFADVKETPVVFYIHNGEKIYCTEIISYNNQYEVKGTIFFDQNDYDWVRFGAETKDGQFLFYGNPVSSRHCWSNPDYSRLCITEWIWK